MKIENLKGTKDYFGEEQELREKLKDIITEKFKLYGFRPLETPILELYEILASKYAGGSEIVKEIYKLKDQGKRKLALRYDLTVPLARFAAMNPGLKMPLKRYEIGKVFRDGPVKLGRFREFTQCDADILGIESTIAEVEILAMASKIFEKLELDVFIKLNNIKILKGFIKGIGVADGIVNKAILAIDKLDKFGVEKVINELEDLRIEREKAENLIKILNGSGEIKDIEKLQNQFSNTEIEQGLAELKELYGFLEDFGLEKKVKISLNLARGLEYYTGAIFEVFLKSGKFGSSLAAGGRYDKMIGDFLGSGRKVPAVGISFGLDAIVEALKLENKISKFFAKSLVFLIPLKAKKESLKILQKLRNAGISADMDFVGRGISKNLEFADKIGAKYALIVGEKELSSGKLTLRDMESGIEDHLGLEEIIKKLRESQ